MPTGYTANIAEGQEFADFVLGCARAFGACVHQRDDSMSDKPRKRGDESSYHVKKLEEAHVELNRLKEMTPKERDELGAKAQQEEIDACQRRFNEKVILRAKYDDMLAKVAGWRPPSPDHENLKKFMIDQINDSIGWDCNTKYDLDELTKATSAKPRDFYNKAVGQAEWDIKYHSEQAAKEKERNSDADRWIEQLYTSLGVEYQ